MLQVIRHGPVNGRLNPSVRNLGHGQRWLGWAGQGALAGRKFLTALVEEQEVTLRQTPRQVLRGYLKILQQVRGQIAQVTRRFRKEVNRRPEACRLMTLPGVSWILAYTIVAEVGQIERFKNKRRFARYCCLAPLADDSGEDDGSIWPTSATIV